jgi:hypothetical protein
MSEIQSIQETIITNKTYILLFFVVIIIVGILVYISNKLNLKNKNCSNLSKSSNTSVVSTEKTSKFDMHATLNQYFIKTAYNSCCVGNFKNDYVDACALKNCASYGVRALDFQIYSLNNKPIVSASSVESKQYKEIYNYMSFYDTMNYVRKFFIDDGTNANCKDPLFLIFRLYTTNEPIYTMMAQVLNKVFGYTSAMGNMIYTLDASNTSLDTTPISELMKRVVIIVDPSYGDKSAFANSPLHDFTSMVTGVSMNNNIYRESNLLGVVAVNRTNGYTTDVSNNLCILYPDLQPNNNNYDFVTSGIFNYLSFIAMNFQHKDQFLIDYNTKFFQSCAFIKKQEMIKTMCLKPEFGATNICKNINFKNVSNDKILNP